MIVSRGLLFTIIVLSQLLFLSLSSVAQTRVWTRLSGTSGYDIGRGLVVDFRGNVYVTGGARGALDGQTWAGSGDICLMKYDSSGTKQWTRLCGAPFNNEGYHVAVDNAGNVYVGGGTQDTFDGQSYAGGFYDICLVKYDSSGTRLWTRLSGSAGMEEGHGVAADFFGNVYVVGTADSGFDGQTIAGSNDICLLKYDRSGTKLWTRLCGTTGNDGGYSVEVDAGGNVYVVGFVSGALDGQTWAGHEDICLMKYDSSGTRLWTRLSGTATTDACYGVFADTEGSIYVTGATYGTLDGQAYSGGGDICLLKYDSSGTKLWTRLCGSASSEIGVDVNGNGSGYVYVTGRAEGVLDGQPNAGGGDISLTKYTGNGTRLWTQLCGTSGWDQGQGVAVDGGGNVFIAGFCSGPIDGQVFAGGYDFFLMKYNGITPLTITSIFPDTEAVANSLVHIQAITGTGFYLNTIVKLCRTGKTDIVATNVAVSGVWTSISCDFSLGTDDTGTWDVVVANEDSRTDTLYHGFTILNQALPWTPILKYPPNDTIKQVFTIRFGWSFSLRAVSYEYQIARDSGFTSIVTDTIGLRDTTVVLTTPRDLLYRFYWRVRAVNGSGTTPWSDVWSYTTVATGVLDRSSGQGVWLFDILLSGRIVRYSLPWQAHVSMRIFDTRGRNIMSVVDETQSAGIYSVPLSNKKLGTGLYLLRFRAGVFEKTQSIAIVR
jgi:hypothetical protein